MIVKLRMLHLQLFFLIIHRVWFCAIDVMVSLVDLTCLTIQPERVDSPNVLTEIDQDEDSYASSF